MSIKKLKITVQDKTYEVVVEVMDDIQKKEQTATNNDKTKVSANNKISSKDTGTDLNTEINNNTNHRNSIDDDNENEDFILSPLSSKVISIEVTLGDEIKKDDKLIVLEAMKMETAIFSPKSGNVKEIFVSKDENVFEGQPLIKVQ